MTRKREGGVEAGEGKMSVEESHTQESACTRVRADYRATRWSGVILSRACCALTEEPAPSSSLTILLFPRYAALCSAVDLVHAAGYALNDSRHAFKAEGD